MLWQEVRERFPHQWLLVEAIRARTEGDRRLLEDVAVIDRCPDGWTALERHAAVQRELPDREFHSVHTDETVPDIRERESAGVRGIRWS
jgi:hypothetical protein